MGIAVAHPLKRMVTRVVQVVMLTHNAPTLDVGRSMVINMSKLCIHHNICTYIYIYVYIYMWIYHHIWYLL